MYRREQIFRGWNTNTKTRLPFTVIVIIGLVSQQNRTIEAGNKYTALLFLPRCYLVNRDIFKNVYCHRPK